MSAPAAAECPMLTKGEGDLPQSIKTEMPAYEKPLCSVPSGFMPEAGEVRVRLSAPSTKCKCCELREQTSEEGIVAPLRAMLSLNGDALSFWSDGLQGPRLVASASLHEWGCVGDQALEAIHELRQRKRLVYDARLCSSHQEGCASSAPVLCSALCSHFVTFTVHLGLGFFNTKAVAFRDAESAAWLRILLGRFSAPWNFQNRGTVEQHEIACMCKAAESLGLASSEDSMAGMNSFLGMPVAPHQAEVLRTKFRLEQVLKSILLPSSSLPQPCEGGATDALTRQQPLHTASVAPASSTCSPPTAQVRLNPAAGLRDPSVKNKIGKECIMSADTLSVEYKVGLPVHRLPEDTLVQLLELLEPKHLDSVSLVCKSLLTAARLCVPGLKLQLYKHQRRALEWMMARERRALRVWNQTFVRFTTKDGTEYFLSNKPGGALLHWGTHVPKDVDDVRGGLLCDEPGMGKTITILALILKTLRLQECQKNQTSPACAGGAPTWRHAAVKEEDEDMIGRSDLPASMHNKRFRFIVGSDSFTWVPSLAEADATGSATPATRQHAQGRAIFTARTAASRASSSPAALVSSLWAADLAQTPLTRRSRAACGGAVDASLCTSSATLIVAPATLVDHWKYQITTHTREGALRVLVVVKHSDMLDAAQMASFDVVLTTFDLLSKEWAIASPSPGSFRWYEMHGTVGRGSQSWRFSPGEYSGVAAKGLLSHCPGSDSGSGDAARSELLQVRWQRVVLDEGHVMGASTDTNRALMLRSIMAGSKWICTGTPTPSTPAAELQHMHGLVKALGIEPYANNEAWRSLVHAPFERHDVGAWVRLHVLMDRIMMRAVKADMERLGEIPSCQVVTTELELSRAEKKAYNGLITVIKRNLILAECGGSRVDSLLYQKNRKYALEAINNARKACCLAGQFLLEIVRAHLQECVLDMRRGHSLHEHGCQCNGSYFDVPTLKQKFHTTRSDKCPLLEDRTRVVPEHRVKIVEEAFAGVGGSSGARAVVNTHDGHIKCDACSRLSVFPFITPCAHMICIDCVDSNSQQATQQCPVCQTHYSHGRFAHFQPSVENPKMEWNAAWIDEVSTKVAILLTRLRTYGFFGKHPVNEMWWSTVIQRRVQHRTPGMLSPAATPAGALARTGRTGRIGKCIIFSNFIEAIDSAANSLSEALHGAGIYMRFTANLKGGMKERLEALRIFRDDPNICILLLDAVGAVGLDLSFVTHIFLLDPIWDKSLEDQVISRAHRLGAKQAIIVEKLIARGTVEQMMEAMTRESDEAAAPACADVLAKAAAGARETDAHDGDVGGSMQDGGDGSSSSGSSSFATSKRHRGDELKRQRETTKVQTILTGLRSLAYDAEEELGQGLRQGHISQPHASAFMQFSHAAAGLQAPSAEHDIYSRAINPDSQHCIPQERKTSFFGAEEYQGSISGYVFKAGEHGLGYYLDPQGLLRGSGAGIAAQVQTPCAQNTQQMQPAGGAETELQGERATKRVRFLD